MLCHKSQLLPLLAATFLFLSPFSSSQPPPISGDFAVDGENGGIVRLGTHRVLAEEPSDEPPLNSSLILASKRTHRRDPLDSFKKYSGGWNISERHYWASVAFTAAPFFVIAAVWFLVFGLCISLICLFYFCCRRQPYGYSRVAYALSLILLVLFTAAAIAGCVVLYTGQGKFHHSTTKTLDYVVDQANTTVMKLKNVSDYLGSAKRVGVNKVFLPSTVQGDIDQIQGKINSSGSTLAARTADNSHDIKHLLKIVRLVLIILAAVMLVLTFVGFVFSLFGLQFFVYTLVIVGWILVTGTFILCGIFLVLHNVAADSCVSMNQWVQHPLARTALDDVLPCVDNATAKETLLRTKEVTSQLVNVINQVITNVSNRNFPPSFAPLYYNQSGPLLPLLCNPFRPDLTDRACSAGEVDLDNATQVWKNYACEATGSGNGVCKTTGRLSPSIYNQMAAGVNVSYGLYHYGPFLVDLQDCTFVRQTFTDIYRDHCPGLRRYSKWIYVGLLMVSVAVMLSLVFWVVYGRERRHRVYTKKLLVETPPGYEPGKY